jgi:hypothetical protein
MGKDNIKSPDAKVPILYIAEEEKDVYPSDGKPPLVKLLVDDKGDAIDNPTVQVQQIFNCGDTEHNGNKISQVQN